MSLSLHGLLNSPLTTSSLPVVEQPRCLSEEVASSLKRSEFNRYKLFLCELDKEIEGCKNNDLKKIKVLKVVTLVFELVVLALLLSTPLFSIFLHPLGIPFWVPYVITFGIVGIIRFVSYKCTVKRNLLENRYGAWLLYRKQLEKFSPKFDSAWKRYGSDLLSPPFDKKTFSEFLKKVADKDLSKTGKGQFSLEDSLDLASSVPTLRRYQTEELSGNKNSLSQMWDVYKRGIVNAYAYTHKGLHREAAALGNQIEQSALLQSGGIDFGSLPIEGYEVVVDMVKRFCAYGVQVLFSAETSMQKFERLFRGYSFLPESQLVLQDIRKLREEFLNKAGILQSYYQRISDAQDTGIESQQIEILEALKGDPTLLSAKSWMRKSEGFKRLLDEKILLHPENMLSALRLKLRNSESSLLGISWGADYMSADEIVVKKRSLIEKLEAIKQELGLIESSFVKFKETGFFKHLFNESKEIFAVVSQQRNLSENDHELLEQLGIKFQRLEEFFADQGTVDQYEHWTQQYVEIIDSCRKFETSVLNPFVEVVCSDGASLMQKARRILFTKDSQARKRKAKTLSVLQNNEKADPSSVGNKTISELSRSLSMVLSSLKESSSDLRVCSLENLGSIPIICKKMSDIYGDLNLKELSVLKTKLWDGFLGKETEITEENSGNIDQLPSVDNLDLDSEIRSLLDEGVHFEEISKKFFVSQAKSSEEVVSAFARSKKSLDALIKASEKDIKKTLLLKSLLACLLPIALLVIGPLLIAFEIWWMPILFTGLITINLALDWGAGYLISKKRQRAQEIRMARTIVEHTEVLVPDIYNQKDKRLLRLSQTLGLDGTNLTVGKNLADSILEIPVDYTARGFGDKRRQEIERLKAETNKAVAASPFKIGPYTSQALLSDASVQELYSPEQKSNLRRFIKSLDQQNLELNCLDQKLDDLVEEKFKLQEALGAFDKRQSYLQNRESRLPEDVSEIEKVQTSLLTHSYQRNFVSRAMELMEAASKDKVSHVKEGSESCINLYFDCRDARKYHERMVALFKKHEELGTVNMLIDDLELASIRKIKDTDHIAKAPTCLKDRLELMGRGGLMSFLDFANQDAYRKNLEKILEKISSFQGVKHSSGYKLLCLQALRDINRLETSLNGLDKTAPFNLLFLSPEVEKLTADMSELRTVAERLVKETRVSKNVAAQRALQAFKAFRLQRFNRIQDKTVYKRVFANLNKHLDLVIKESKKSSGEEEDAIVQSLVGLPSHVLREQYLYLQTKIAKDLELLERKKQQVNSFEKLKQEFYGKDINAPVDTETNRLKLVERQELQRKLVEIERSRKSLIEQIKDILALREYYVRNIKFIKDSVKTSAQSESSLSKEESN